MNKTSRAFWGPYKRNFTYKTRSYRRAFRVSQVCRLLLAPGLKRCKSATKGRNIAKSATRVDFKRFWRHPTFITSVWCPIMVPNNAALWQGNVLNTFQSSLWRLLKLLEPLELVVGLDWGRLGCIGRPLPESIKYLSTAKVAQ